MVLSTVTYPFENCFSPIALPCVAFQGFDVAHPTQGGRWAIFWLHSPLGAGLSLHTNLTRLGLAHASLNFPEDVNIDTWNPAGGVASGSDWTRLEYSDRIY